MTVKFCSPKTVLLILVLSGVVSNAFAGWWRDGDATGETDGSGTDGTKAGMPVVTYIIIVIVVLLLISCCWLWYNKKFDPMDLCRTAVPAVVKASEEAAKGVSASAKKVGKATASTLNAAAETLDTASGNQQAYMAHGPHDSPINTLTTQNIVNSALALGDADVRVACSGDQISNAFELFLQRALAWRPVFLRRLQAMVAKRISHAKWSSAMRMHKPAWLNQGSTIALSGVSVQEPPQGVHLSKSFSEDSPITYTEEDGEEEGDILQSNNLAGQYFAEPGVARPHTQTTLSESEYSFSAPDSSSYTGRKKAAPMARCATIESDTSFMSNRVLTMSDVEGGQLMSKASLDKLAQEWREYRRASLDKLAQEWREYRRASRQVGEIMASHKNVANNTQTLSSSSPSDWEHGSTPVIELPAAEDELLKPSHNMHDSTLVLPHSATGDMLSL